MNTKYNILTICSALIFIFLIIFPENNDNNFIIYFLIFTSILYKYLHLYDYGSRLYVFSRKLDQIVISFIFLSYFSKFYNHKLENIHLLCISTIVNYNFKTFKLLLMSIMLKILYFSFKNDIFISCILIFSIIIALISYYSRTLIKKWTFEISWCWHLSCCCILTCLSILSSDLFIPYY